MKLPAEWQRHELGTIAEVVNGRGFKPHEWEDSGLPIIRIQNLNGSGDFNFYSGQYDERIEVRSGELLFAWSGSRGTSFGPHIWRRGKGLLNYHTWKINPSQLIDKSYLYHFLRLLTKRIEETAHGASALVHIQKSWIEAYEIPLPPLPEQRRIAEVLSTWDSAIEQTERLIDAKQRRKKALMQQLLTGKKRFAEFEGEEWRRLRMKDAFKRITDPVPEGVHAVLSITSKTGFVDQRQKFSKVIAGKAFEKYVHLKRGDFSYNKGNSLTYPQGCIYRLSEFDEGAAPSVYFSFRSRRADIDGEYYRFYFLSGLLNRQLSRLINSGVRNDGLLNLDAEDFFAMRVDVPPVAEQRKIAAVLNTADEEVVQLKNQLAALRRQKQGLMQVLLTGKVRVKVEEGEYNA